MSLKTKTETAIQIPVMATVRLIEERMTRREQEARATTLNGGLILFKQLYQLQAVDPEFFNGLKGKQLPQLS